MSISLSAFLSMVQQIADEQPTYRSGGTGADGTCDCVGLIMGAMYRCGHSRYALHGSNYFARNQMITLNPISSAGDCYPGMIVYKTREAGDSGYSLPDRYKPGGQYYNGDLKDYYHVGVVTSTAPFCITHCTSSGGVNGITTDSKLGKWCYGGQLNDVAYTDSKEDEPTMKGTATVYAENGKPVNLRKMPTTTSDRIARVPVGTTVTVTESAGDWATVEYDGKHGYMMTQFLKMNEDEGDEPVSDETLSALMEKLDLLDEKVDALQESVNRLLEQTFDVEG